MANLGVLESFAQNHPWIDFLAEDPATRSNTSGKKKSRIFRNQSSATDIAVIIIFRSFWIVPWPVCMTVKDLNPAQVKKMLKILESEGVAYDIGSYKLVPLQHVFTTDRR